jgi:hypothetical protein
MSSAAATRSHHRLVDGTLDALDEAIIHPDQALTLYSPTTSSPGWHGVSLPLTYGLGLRTRLPFADIEHARGREGRLARQAKPDHRER